MPDFLEELEAGREVGVEPLQLDAAEDALAQLHLPPYVDLRSETVASAMHSWNTRERLYRAIKGSQFMGDVLDLRIKLMGDPAQELIDSQIYPYRRKRYEQLHESVTGFVVHGRLCSSLSSSLGNLERPIWVVRAPKANVSKELVLWRRIVGGNRQNDAVAEAYALSAAKGATLRGVGKDIFRRSRKTRSATLDDGSDRGLGKS